MTAKQRKARKRGSPQPKGFTRHKLASGVEEDIWQEVARLARTFHRTRAWVVTTILADYLKIDLDLAYYQQPDDAPQPPRTRKRRRKE